MDTRNLSNWVRKLAGTGDSRERRAVLVSLEPILMGMEQLERDILFPVLRRFIGFSEWMQEACAHHGRFRELFERARTTSDHERIIDITDELVRRIATYVDGIERVLQPRLVQALSPIEYSELRAKLQPKSFDRSRMSA